MSLVVQKYGGTSVGTLRHIQNVADHITRTVSAGHKVIVTVSAMGTQTDELMGMALHLAPKPPRREVDMLLTAGERISMALLSIALEAREVPSVSLTGSQSGILTDDTHGNARINRILGDRIRESLNGGRVVIVAGFQGVSPKTKEVTTLGRGGTDLSALALAAALDASACQLYKDVRGLYTADPRLVPRARVLDEISWPAMTNLAWGGATVLHPRAAHLAAKHDLSFEIRSSLELERPGTTVRGRNKMESVQVEAIAHKKGLTFVECELQGPAEQPLGWALGWLWQEGQAPAINHQSVNDEGTVTLTQVIPSDLVDEFLEALRNRASALTVKRRRDGQASLCVVGSGFQQSPETVQTILNALDQPPGWIEIRNDTVTLCVPEDRIDQAVEKVHDALFQETHVGDSTDA